MSDTPRNPGDGAGDPSREHTPRPSRAPATMPDFVLGDEAAPTDDTPTIISRSRPAQGGEHVTNLRGRHLAHFELIEPIGVGGMAAVLRARDTQLDRTVALKILPPDMAADSENVRRFHQEARAAARLDHENIARVFYCGEDQRLHFIAFEFVEGDNLRSILDRRGRLPVREAVHYMLQIATGLAHAAARGVVHRDIKPSNIIISPNGRAKLVDMGLARNMDGRYDKGLTQSGVTLGTFDYISPEQALEPRDADVRSDIYSLGCTFYHMLTGQPPVPEGTAAKKLHHHQHVPPLDPRLLNPDIPDGVTAVLARMMAKDLGQRYQRAEHLVQHLIQVAQQLGGSPEVPEGLLFVDAPLPAPPQRRLGLMAALAVAGLGAILLALSLIPGGGTPAPPPPVPPGSSNPQAAQPAPKAPDPGVNAARGQPATVRQVKNQAEWDKALAESPPPETIELPAELALKGGSRFQTTGEVTVRPRDAKGGYATVRMKFDRAAAGEPWAGLLLESGSYTFENIRFVLDVRVTPESVAAAVLVAGARRATFRRCVFVQDAPAVPLLGEGERHLVPAASVAVENGGEEAGQPAVVLDHCYFVTGQSAVAVNGPVNLSATSCCFGPHGALFHVRGQSSSSKTHLDLQSCSAFVVRGPAFRVDDRATCSVKAKHSIFSSPDTPPGGQPGDLPHLIRQRDNDKKAVSYEDWRNCYHNLNAYWVLRNEPKSTPADFREMIGAQSEGAASSFLTAGKDSANPWALKDPLSHIKADDPLAPSNYDAFRINPTLLAVRQGDEDPQASLPLGAPELLHFRYPPLRPLAPPPGPAQLVLKPNEKVVDPNEKTGGGVYKTLNGALAEAKSGDEIRLRFTGTLPVKSIHLLDDLSVTLKADAGHRPVLLLDPKADDEDAAVFHVHHGQLRLERLAFEIGPAPEGVSQKHSRTVVAVVGNAQCVFKDCLLTLKAGGGTAAHVVALSDPGVPRKPPAGATRTVPRVEVLGCFVRGEGTFFHVPQSRPFDLRVENSAVALEGSLLAMGGHPGEMPASDSGVKVELSRVTTYLTEHLLLIQDPRAGKGLLATHVTAADCLFHGTGKSLVQIEGPDTEQQLMRLFGWGGTHNAYAGYTTILDHQSAMVGSPPLRFDQTKWQNFFRGAEGDGKSEFVKAVPFDLGPQRDDLAQLTPQGLRVRSEKLAGFGANLEQLSALVPPAAARPAGLGGDDISILDPSGLLRLP